MTGSSTRQGTHHAAHTLTTTGCPRRARTRACRPLRAPGSRSLACACSAASAGGAPSSLACSSCAEILLTFGWLGVLDSGACRGRRRRSRRGRSPRGSMAASGAFAEGCQTRRRARRTRPQSAVSCVLLTGRVAESREVPPVHRPRTSRGAPSRQAPLHAATLRSAQIARSWLIPCRRPLRPQRFPIRPPSSAPRRSRVSASFTTAKTPPSRWPLARAAAAPSTTRCARSTPARRSRRPDGAGATRCCSASSACSARTSRAWPTARCSTPTRSTRSRAR